METRVAQCYKEGIADPEVEITTGPDGAGRPTLSLVPSDPSTRRQLVTVVANMVREALERQTTPVEGDDSRSLDPAQGPQEQQ